MREAVAIVPEGRRVFSRMTVEENLAMGGFFADRDQFQTRIKWVYELFPRLHERRIQRAGTMSGGEQQMLAIGRALMSQPRLLLLDEPSLGLAPIIIQQIFDTIEQLREQGMTIFLVEQNANQALKLADRGYVLENGHVVLEDTGDALLANEAVRSAYLGGLIHRNPASFTSPVCSPDEALAPTPGADRTNTFKRACWLFFCTCMLYNKRVQLWRFL
ncbi:branched chain amino acid ABC transporter ATPase [Klebsiella pneumoniae]|nr:branched chain amino acid ABC transporter ATPase [Klebsiella pneumoniae]